MLNIYLAINIFLRSKLRNSVYLKLFLFRLIWLLPESWRQNDKTWNELNKISKNKKDIFFVNIGANDGLAGDPLVEFIFRRHWRGLLVEPVPYVFSRLQEVYGSNLNIKCIQVAIAEKSCKKKFYYLKKTDKLPPGYDQIGSFNKEHILKLESMFPGCNKYIDSTQITCLSLSDLLLENKVNHVDVFLIDTEGYDHEIVKQIDLSRYKPELVIYEEVHLSSENSKLCRRIFEENNYKITKDGGNIIAKRNELIKKNE